MPFFSTPEYFTKRLDYLKAHAAGCGRDPESIEPSGWVYLVITDDAELAEIDKRITAAEGPWQLDSQGFT